MELVSQQELFTALRNVNPWWEVKRVPGLPTWRRAAFQELLTWLTNPPTHRALLVSGARRVGKTTLLRQTIVELVNQGINPQCILYATFDDPLLKLAGLQGLLDAWAELQSDEPDIEYLFLDEIQYTKDWQTWLKHEVDFNPKRRIAVTGSAIPLTESPESGVGRWHTIKLPTLSFNEYLQIRGVTPPRLQRIKSLAEIAKWSPPKLMKVAAAAKPLTAHFHEYLLRGGFPETAKINDIATAQQLLREDIVDKVLKRDMTALFGTRHVVDMEKLFLYLCRHNGGLLDKAKISSAMEVSASTVNKFLDQFEAAHLIYRLRPFGYGSQILKGKQKAYLADASISGSVLGRGMSLLSDSALLGAAVEAAFFKHLFTRYYPRKVQFYYWRHTRTQFEVDIVADLGDQQIPFEVKYTTRVVPSELKGLAKLCAERSIRKAYVITRVFSDFGPWELPGCETAVLRIPAPLACFWLSESAASAPTDHEC